MFAFLVLLLSGLPAQRAGASPGWWDTDWGCRKAITISNSSASALANYQVKIDVSYESAMQSDFDDLRFASASDAPLDYWLESKTDSSSATIWVEVDSIAASGDTIIYMYYGNPTASSASNGDETFEFFDDFEGDLSKWDIHIDTDVAITASYGNPAPCLEISGGSTSGYPYGLAVIGSDATYTGFQDGIIEADVYPTTNALPEIIFRGNYSANTGYKGRWDTRSGSEPPWMKPPYAYWSEYGTDVPRFGLANQWQKAKLVINGSTFQIYSNDNLKSTETFTDYPGPGEIGLANHYGAWARFDNVRVRKYASPEPTYSVGPEESLPTVDIDVSDTLINEADVVGIFDVVATFSKAMNTGVTPTISFDPDVVTSGTLVFASGGWSVGDTVYTATYDIADVDEEVTNVDVSVGGADDPAGNRQNPDPTTEVNLFDVDTVAPTVDITATATDPTNVSPIPMTVTFSEDVTGFMLGDITVGNGTAGNLAGSGSVYTFDVTPVADGVVTVDIAAGVAQDAAGNDNTAAAQFTIAYDSTGQTGGTTKDKYYTNEDVRVTASGFLPGADVDVYVTEDRAWSSGDSIPPYILMDTFTANDSGNITNQVIWKHPLRVGEYDVVFDADHNGDYDELWDLVDDPNHPGFVVVSPTVGGKIYHINKASVLLPWLGLALVLILVLGGSTLALRGRRTR
jgi:hypothetical protein